MRPRRISLSSVLGLACHLSGGAVTLLLVRFLLSPGLEASLPVAVLQITLVWILALLIGNVVKEWVFALTESAVTALGHPFVRMAATLRGRRSTEIGFPGGTWIRYEAWRGGAAWEWTEPDGSCTRVESPAMTVVRAGPPTKLQGPLTHGGVCTD